MVGHQFHHEFDHESDRFDQDGVMVHFKIKRHIKLSTLGSSVVDHYFEYQISCRIDHETDRFVQDV